jgi:hypothetical protein
MAAAILEFRIEASLGRVPVGDLHRLLPCGAPGRPRRLAASWRTDAAGRLTRAWIPEPRLLDAVTNLSCGVAR